MTIHPILALLLLGHVLGDFYFQTNNMAKNKDNPDDKRKRWEGLLKHTGVYSVCMAAILLIATGFSLFGLYIVLGASLSHFVIDLCKKRIPFKRKFITDQLLHFLTLITLWRIWGQCLLIQDNIVQNFLLSFVSAFGETPESLLVMTLGILWVLMPVGVLIEKGEIWDFSKSGEKCISTKPEDSKELDEGENPSLLNISPKGAGKIIGYLERTIIFVLLLNSQFGAVAFVLTAKSVARFPEIGKSKNATALAEYYIIGTLLSVTSVFVITFLFGLI